MMSLLIRSSALTLGFVLLLFGLEGHVFAQKGLPELDLPGLSPAEQKELEAIKKTMPDQFRIKLFANEAAKKPLKSGKTDEKIRPVAAQGLLLLDETGVSRGIKPSQSHSLHRPINEAVRPIQQSARQLEEIAASYEEEGLYSSADLLRERAKALWLMARELRGELIQIIFSLRSLQKDRGNGRTTFGR